MTPGLLASAAGSGAHPIWHFGTVAAFAVGAFLVIHVRERRERRPRTSTRVGNPAPVTVPTQLGVWLAVASLGAAALHALVCPAHFREATIFGVFFLVAAALQAAWATIVLVRPSKKVLVTGAIANIGVIGLWILSRTAGLPLGPDAWTPEAVGGADMLATLLELAIVAGVGWLVLPAAHVPSRAQAR
jgi:hypothetical protein